MKILLLILAMVIAPFSAIAETAKIEAMPSGLYKLDPTHASLTWKVSHLGLSQYTARFKKFDVDLMLDPVNVENSKVKATIDVTSIETDYPKPEEKDFNAKLRNDVEWFNSSKFPSITFVSTKIEKTGEKTGKMTGDVTFLGVTKPVTLDVVFNAALGNHPFANKPAIGFSATGKLKRSDFGFNTYIPQIGDEVTLSIETEFMYAK